MIFEWVDTLAPTLPNFYQEPYASRLHITQVCRLWRNVAINTPRLWGLIYSHSQLELAKLFLERSKSAPLYIETLDWAPNMDLVALWFSRADRLKGVHLKYSYNSTWIPFLKELKASNLDYMDISTTCTTNIEFATELDADQVPFLRCVRLTNCYFNINTPVLSQVRQLHIKHHEHRHSQPMLEVMLALKEMQYLESLELVDLLQFSDAIPGDLQIESPCLTDIKIEVKDPRVIISMLQSFACPNIRSIVAEATEGVSPALAVQATGAFYSIFPRQPTPSTLKLRLLYEELNITMVVEPSSILDPTTVSPGTPQPSQIILHGPADFSVPPMILSLSPDNPLKVLELALGQGYPRPVTFIRESLVTFTRTLNSLETLVTPTIQDLAVILSDVPSKVNRSRRGPTLPFSFPSLKHCHVTGYASLQRHDSSLKNLRKALERRHLVKAGIESLRFRYPLPKSDLKLFKSQVRWLEYIGFEGVEIL
ncbi:hypothetical protein ONZ45_g12637 [Pleurotus djamor]|nr:hypothetical protein ONZ45_g12637 [Pleurotus djamor]